MRVNEMRVEQDRYGTETRDKAPVKIEAFARGCPAP